MAGRAKFLVCLVTAVLGLGLAGIASQALANRSEARRFPEPGRLVDVGGHNLMLHCTGAGYSTVILEAGFGDNLAEWERVQPELARFVRVCSYDRAGYGGSDAGPFPRTSRQSAIELHRLLERAGEKPPYVLVGASFGGYSVRVFNGLYPGDVHALVLVDAVQEDQYTLLPRWWAGPGQALVQRCRRQAFWAPVYIDMGVARLWLKLQGIEIQPAYLILQSKYVRARASEAEAIRSSAEQARAAGHIQYKPLIVLTAGKRDPSLRNATEDFHGTWVNELQPRLARLSKRGTLVILADSSHDIPNDRPDAIVDAVRELAAYSTPKASSTLPQAPVKRP